MSRRKRKLNRRDRVLALANGMQRLDTNYHDEAWRALAIRLEALADHPMPKFEHLWLAIRGATLSAFALKRNREADRRRP